MEIIVLKFLATSALLMAFYHFALRKKASYKATRIYLLSLPVASLLMSVLTFEVYTPSQSPVAVLSQSPAPATAPMTMFQAQEMPVEMGPASVSESQTPALSPVEFTPSAIVEDIPFWQNVDWLKLIGLSIPAVSVILLLIAFYYIMKLMVVKSRMKAETTAEGYAIIRSASVQTPFSFAKTIFFPADLDKEKENLIIRHEKAHIAHRHYVDVWVSEFFTRIFWFNPSVWLCRSALRNVHEFEADHDVLSSGANVITYQATLLEMVLNESCPVVSGFNHSFIRSRFIEMRASTAGTLGRFGKIGTLVCLLAMFCVFTFVECSPKDTKNNTLESIQLKEPQKFVIEGTIDPGCTDSCYMITLSDEYLHLADTPSVCIPVVDNKFHYEIDLKHIICGKIQRVLPGGELDKGNELFFVPGESLNIIRRSMAYVEYDGIRRYQPNISRGIEALRYATNWESPHFPKFKGNVWHNPKQECVKTLFNYSIYVKDVYFNDDETIVCFAFENTNKCFPLIQMSNAVLKDNNGNVYKFKRAETGFSDMEMLVFGQYVVFEPMPKDVESFSYFSNYKATIDTNLENPFLISNIHKADEKDNKPNFEITITGVDSMKASGIIIKKLDFVNGTSRQVADLTFDKKHTIQYSAYLDEAGMYQLLTTYDGIVGEDLFYSKLPFVPGEKATITVNDWKIFNLDGSNFYKEWQLANDVYFGNYESGNPFGEASIILYSEEHINELGFVMNCLWRHSAGVDEILNRVSSIPYFEKMLKDLEKRNAPVRESLNHFH